MNCATHVQIDVEFVTASFGAHLAEYGSNFIRFILTSDAV